MFVYIQTIKKDIEVESREGNRNNKASQNKDNKDIQIQT